MMRLVKKFPPNTVMGSFAGKTHFEVPMFINNKFVKATNPSAQYEVIDPSTQEVVAMTPQSSTAEMESAVSAAATAFESWKEVPISVRQRYMMKYHQLIRERTNELAEIITVENGKTMEDSKGSIFRGLETIEHSFSGGSLLMGETLENVSKSVDTYSYRQPLGVCAGIAPFNFPAMVPLWMFPIALVSGNTFVLKPSERVPLSTMKMMEWLQEVELPPGVMNVVHGGKPTVEFMCRSPPIQAVSFVGGNRAGEFVYSEGSRHGKRVQANLGAKNHAVVLPDADKDDAITMLCNAVFGAAGQRCMALSVVVLVGDAKNWTQDIVEKAKLYRVGPGHASGVDLGPLISKAAKENATKLTMEAVQEGATLQLNGLNIKIDGYPNGNFVGPTVIDNVTTNMKAYQDELFSPVMSIVYVDTLQDAIQLINSHSRANGTAIFTSSGAAARKFQHEIKVGQVGINVPIPVPLPMFSFTGWKTSMNGDLHFNGKMIFEFFTKTKTITSRWKEHSIPESISGAFPTLT